MSDKIQQQMILEIALQSLRSKRSVQLNDSVVYVWGRFANMRLTVLMAQPATVFVRPDIEKLCFPVDREDIYHHDDFLAAIRTVRRRRQIIERMMMFLPVT